MNKEAFNTMKEIIKELLTIVATTMNGSNFIPSYELENKEVRQGLYLLMSMYDLTYSVESCGPLFGEVIKLHPKEDESKSLTYEEIKQRKINISELTDAYNNILANKLDLEDKTQDLLEDSLFKNSDNEEKEQYGWLSPTGYFIKADWGDHDKSAEEILKRYYSDEYEDYKTTSGYQMTRDVICSKGWCLIHSPSSVGVVITNLKPLTKEQNKFLYDYFVKLGDYTKASLYLED